MVNAGLITKVNLGLHIFQAVWSVVIIGVCAASMLQDGPTSGAMKYTFALCWLNIIPLIYLTMSPRFPRTRMFAHPYWVAAINLLEVILWFASFVAIAAYTNKGISSGQDRETDKDKKSAGGCAVFPAGTGETEKACSLNHDATGLSVVMWLSWVLTAVIGSYGAWYFSRNSVSPYEDLSVPSHDITETTKDAFSNDDYARLTHNGGHGYDDDDETDLESTSGPYSASGAHNASTIGPARSDSYGPRSESAASHGRSASVVSSTYDAGYSSAEPYAAAHPGRPLSWANEREPYAGIGGHAPVGAPPSGGSVLSMPEGPGGFSYHH